MTTQTALRNATRRRRAGLKAAALQHFGILSISTVFLFLFVFFSVRAPHFLTATNMVNVLQQVAPTVIVAMAMTFVITTGQIDLSVGSVVALTAVSLAMVTKSTGSATVGLAAALAIGIATGALNGAFVAYGRLQSFIVTLAALTAIRGVAQLLSQGYSTPITNGFLLDLGQAKVMGLYTPTWLAATVVVICWYVFSQTRFGRYLKAVGSNAESLRRAGVNIKRVQMAALVLTGTFASIGGVLIAARLSAGSPSSGFAFELEVITAVVLGGTALMGGRGSIVGTVIGALTLGLISNGLVLLGINSFWVPVVQGMILLTAIFANSKLLSRLVGKPTR